MRATGGLRGGLDHRDADSSRTARRQADPAARDALRDAARAGRLPRWIDEGDAADLALRRREPRRRGRRSRAVRRRRRHRPAGATARRKRLLVADMDSTMIGQECIDELADYAGIKAEVAAITERAMQGELDFAARSRAGRAARRAGRSGHRPLPRRAGPAQCPARRPWSGRCARTAPSCLLVSGGFTAFAEPVAEDDRLRPGRRQPAVDRRRHG